MADNPALETIEDSLSQYGVSYSKIKTTVVAILVLVALIIGCSSLLSILKAVYNFTMKN